MAKYTVELYCLLDRGYDIGLSKYPIFDESYRESLNHKIEQHYYYREIGQETPDRFKRMMERTMNEIMPYYNQLYLSEREKFDWLITNSLREDNHRDGANSNSSEGKINGSSQTSGGNTLKTSGNSSQKTNIESATEDSQIYQDTPQGLLGGKEYATNKTDNEGTSIQNSNSTSNTNGESFGENYSESMSDNTSKTKSTGDFIEDGQRIKEGRDGWAPDDLLKKHRDNMLNIDMMVIEDLASLFLNLY